MPNGDETVTKFIGTIATTMSDNGQPNTSFSGSWENISGVGQYKGIYGSGTYKGYFTSQTEYVVDWKGYYKLK